VEVSALKHAGAAGAHAKTPLLRLQSDERLVAMVRRGNHHAFEALVSRYQSRLLAFCRHMLASKEDAEDVLQEVFAAAFNAILADERPINARPWLYRIARNRSLNHLRKQTSIGVDSMDVHYAEHGETTADRVHKREEFRQLLTDVQDLPETQRTALLLREIDALSYDQISEVMDTTVPSVKSLLVRARVSLAEAAEARLLTCEEVRDELGQVAEGLARTTPPVRRHLRTCDRCQGFRKHLRQNNKALAALFPVGPLLLLKKLVLAHLGTASAASGGGAAAGGATAAGVAGGAAGGLLQAGASAVATKAVAGLAAAAIVTAGAVEVKHASDRDKVRSLAEKNTPTQVASAATAVATPRAVQTTPQPVTPQRPIEATPQVKAPNEPKPDRPKPAASKPELASIAVPTETEAPIETPVPETTPEVEVVLTATPEPTGGTQHDGDTTTLPVVTDEPEEEPPPPPVPTTAPTTSPPPSGTPAPSPQPSSTTPSGVAPAPTP
jgi:RNA polymerase sigma factor (sigma-70 family)